MKKCFYFAFLALTIGCGDSSESTLSSNSDSEGSEVTESMFESAAFINKYNGYVDFKNSFHTRVVDGYSRYFEWAGEDETLNKDARNMYPPYTLHTFHIERLEGHLEAEPVIAGLDEQVKLVLTTSKALDTKIIEVNKYYQMEDYKDDNLSKGEVFHKELITAFEAYFKAYGDMDVEFEKVADKLAAVDLKRYKEDGQMIQYNLMLNIAQARDFLTIIDTLDGNDLVKLNLVKFEENRGKYRTSLEEIEKLMKDEAAVKKSGFDNSELSSYVNQGGAIIKETRNLKDRIKNKNFKYSITHPRIPSEGSPAKILEEFDDLISIYNRMQS